MASISARAVDGSPCMMFVSQAWNDSGVNFSGRAVILNNRFWLSSSDVSLEIDDD